MVARDQTVQVSLTYDEARDLQRLSSAAGLSKSAYVRMVLKPLLDRVVSPWVPETDEWSE